MTGLLMIYVGLLMKQKKKWDDRDDVRRWQKWEEYEDIREEMGYIRSVEPIPKRALRKTPKYKSHERRSVNGKR